MPERWSERALAGFCGLVLMSCGGGTRENAASPPPKTVAAQADAILGVPPGWSDANMKSAELYRAEKYDEALAVLEAFARDHPRFDEAELMLGDNHLTIPAADAASRHDHLVQAATHFRRGLDLARLDDTRRWGQRQLLRVYGPKELDRPGESEAIARAYIKDRPGDPYGYAQLAAALRRQHREAEAVGMLRDAGPRIDEPGRREYAEALVTHAKESPALPTADQRQLLAAAEPIVTRVLADNPDDMKGLGIKSAMVAVEARLEPNPAKRRALEVESKRLDDASTEALQKSLAR
jgi:tetratricopeptide (TPR) repeat protein